MTLPSQDEWKTRKLAEKELFSFTGILEPGIVPGLLSRTRELEAEFVDRVRRENPGKDIGAATYVWLSSGGHNFASPALENAEWALRPVLSTNAGREFELVARSTAYEGYWETLGD